MRWSGETDLVVSVLAGEEHGGPTISLGVVDVLSARLEQFPSDLLSKAKEGLEGGALACGSGWARASASVAV